MKRHGLLLTIVVFGALSGAGAQQPAPRTVVIHTIGQQVPISDPTYSFAGVYFLSNGGANALAVTTPDGIVLIDAKLPGWSPAVLETLQQVADDPIVGIINTNADEDHAGANREYKGKIEIVMQENASTRFLRRSGAGGASPAIKTFGSRTSLTIGGTELQVYHFGKGHSDGDAIVVLPHARLAFVGDLFAEKSVPVIDRASGGSALELPQTLARAVAGITGVDRVITGHGPAPEGRARTWPTWNDFREYADFTRDFVAAAQAAWKAGKTVEQAVSELRLPDKYKGYRMDGAKTAIETIFAELKQAAPQR
jgi:glyoxylase-like metal-dependent hydrolase (beta-lactamase superfamily II)